jgi:lipoyl(octanoyl) transferase
MVILHYDAVMEWTVSDGLTDYDAALAHMEARVEGIAERQQQEQIWLVEHPPLYTAGTSAKIHDLRQPRFPVYQTGRGGQYTYHGPNQRVAYVMLNLKQRYAPAVPDIRHFVFTLEQWIIDTLQICGVTGERREGRIGIWVEHAGGENKIAALGIRIRKGVTLHGIAINVAPDLSHFSGIVPCGISEHGVTSLRALGLPITMHEVDNALQATCPYVDIHSHST